MTFARPVHALVTLLPSFEGYLHSLALRPATVRNYLADARAFVRWLGGRADPRPLVEPSDFLAYREHLADSDHSPATVLRRLHTLRLYGRFLWEHGALSQNPAGSLEGGPTRNGDETVPRVLDAIQIERLWDTVPQVARPSLRRRDTAILAVMLEAGLRVAEVAQLRVEDLVATRDGLRLVVGEDGHARQVPVNENLAHAMREYLNARPHTPGTSFLFISQQRKPLCARAIQRLIETYARAAQLAGVNANMLRHTRALQWLIEKHDPNLVAQWLGKRHPDGLQKYQALLPKEK